MTRPVTRLLEIVLVGPIKIATIWPTTTCPGVSELHDCLSSYRVCPLDGHIYIKAKHANNLGLLINVSRGRVCLPVLRVRPTYIKSPRVARKRDNVIG